MTSIWPKCKLAARKNADCGLRIADCGLPLRPSAPLLLCFLFSFSLPLFLLAACRPAPPVLKIGLVAPFEGAERGVGYDAIYSARLAVREINAAGGIGGYAVALVALDDGGDGQLAAETAAALAADPALIAVVGHGLAHTTAAGGEVYAAVGLPHLPLLATADPNTLSAEFIGRYEAITPFDETAGPYAGPTYEAFQQLWAAMRLAYEQEGEISRAGVARWLGE
jgi:ABC-type branched-subunit amino acid transport system substrate-binding protein